MSRAAAVRQPLTVFQAFIDDSYTANGEFVLAGHIATAEAWVAFAKDWEELLPFGTLAPNGKYHFKMSEMALLPERMERLPAFWRAIQKHVAVSLSCRINIAELRRARTRIYVPAADVRWGFWENPYLVASRCLLDMFHIKRKEIESRIPANEPVDFIFDEQTEKAVILEAWTRYIASRPDETRNLYGATPRFENDQKFLPLQAADFWAWWIRKWSESGDLRGRIHSLKFGEWAGMGTARVLVQHYSFNEDQMVESMIAGTRSMVGPHPIIFDVTFSDQLARS